jgi:hypothetical protein
MSVTTSLYPARRTNPWAEQIKLVVGSLLLIAAACGSGLENASTTGKASAAFDSATLSTANAHAHHAKCDNSSLHGRYAFRSEASPTGGGRRLNLALLEFNGDGTYANLGFTVVTDGVVATGTLAANYQINSDCSGSLLNPDGSVQGPIIVKEDGDEFYFLRTNPASLMLTATGTRIDRHRE